MKTTAKIQILAWIGLILMLSSILQKPLGLPQWSGIVGPLLGVIFIWASLYVHWRAKRRGEALPAVSDEQKKKTKRLSIVVILLATLTGPLWLPYIGPPLPFHLLVVVSLVSCAVGMFALWVGIKVRKKL